LNDPKNVVLSIYDDIGIVPLAAFLVVDDNDDE